MPMLFQDFLIRRAKAVEFDKIHNFIAQNPEEMKYREGDDVDFAIELRKKTNFIPELELVAEKGDHLVGHVMFSHAEVLADNGNSYKALFLDPLSISRSKMDAGVCKALINSCSEAATRMGYTAIFLCGNHNLFHSLGFQLAKKWNIYHEKLASNLMLAKELKSNSLSQISGSLNL